MKRCIVSCLLVLLIGLGVAVPAQSAVRVVRPEQLILVAKSIPSGDHVTQDPSGVFAMLASPFVEFWAPVNIPVGSTIRELSFVNSSYGPSSVTLRRVRDGAPELLATATGSPGDAYDTVTTTLTHRVAPGWRYFVKVRLGNDCLVGKISLRY